MAEGLANDGISEERRAALAADGDSQEVMLRALGSKAQVVKWLLYGLVLWLLKGSLLHFFAVRLTVRPRHLLLKSLCCHKLANQYSTLWKSADIKIYREDCQALGPELGSVDLS